MYKIGLSLVLALVIVGFILGADESKEPSLNYVLNINGQNYPISPGKELEIKGTFKDPKVTLQVSNTRLFAYEGVQFMYPGYFTWEAETKGDTNKNWTLSGTDFKIMYFVLPKEATLDDYVNGIVKEFGKKKCRTEKISRQLGETVYDGKRIISKIINTGIITDVFLLSQEEKTRLLVLQDTAPEDNGNEDETQLASKLLTETFKVDKEPTNGQK
jgi:uncharacterized lipoprotein YehR (DUF1307 family)